MPDERPITLPLDTTLETARTMTLLYRRIDPAERVSRALRFLDDGRRLAAAGVRHRHPQYTDEQVRLAVGRLCLGRELFVKAFGFDIEP